MFQYVSSPSPVNHMAVIPWKPMMSRINICAVCVTACFKLAGYKLYKCSRQNRHKKRGSMLIANLFALDTETRRTIIDKPPAASWPLPDLSSLTWFFYFFLGSPVRPLSYSDAAMHGRGRPLQSGGAAAHPQTAGWRQWRGNRGQRECGGELGEWTFTILGVRVTLGFCMLL